MATLERVEIKTDPDFMIHTSYYDDFFLLRTRVLVNGRDTEIRSIKDDKHVLVYFRRSGSATSMSLLLIVNTVSAVLQQYGVYRVHNFYYEQSLLFHVVFSSELCLKNFILAMGEVKCALEPELQSLFVQERESPQQLTVEVQPDLFLVSPNRQQETKGADLNVVTIENYSTFLTRWKDSKLFDFGSLHQEKRQSHSKLFKGSLSYSMHAANMGWLWSKHILPSG